MQIYRGTSSIYDVKPTDASYRDFAIMGNDIVILDFYSKIELALQQGDYIIAFTEHYSLVELSVPVIEKGVYHYVLKFYGNYKELEKVKVFLYDSARDLTQSDFNYTCTPTELLQLIVNNLNAVQSHPWAVGEVIAGDVKTISISNQNCLEVLSNAASEWDTEYYLTNFNIHLRKRSVDNGQSFAIGSGLVSVVAEKDKKQRAINRLYAFGGTKNLPSGYSASRLQMDVPYLDQAAAEVIEDVKVFDDIYPRRTGTISAVRLDSNGIYYFSDSGISFNPNDLQITGLAKHVIFQTGQLIGLDFEVNFHDSTSEFEIIRYQESGGQELPASPLIPAVGDTYILYNIYMPASYVTAAEAELKTAAQAYFDDNVSDKLSFNIIFDEVYFTKNNLSISPGEMITISHPQIEALKQGLKIRATAFKNYINKPNKYDSVKVSDAVYFNPLTSVENKVIDVETLLKKAGLNKSTYQARNWRDIAEVASMIYSVQTELLLVGNKQGQFDLQGVVFTPNPGGNTDEFDVSAGILIHRTIPEDNPGTWSLAAAVLNISDETKPFYLYAKCSRSTSSAIFIVSETSIAYDFDPLYYHFLIGIISSLVGNARVFQTVYGFTQISGNEIVTGIVQSKDGKTYFDLDHNEIGGAIKFLLQDGSSYKSLIDLDTEKQDAVVNGQTLIAGGYINTQFIDVTKLIAQIVKTKDTGARVEINGISNSVVVYDANDNAKIVIAPKNVMSESDIATTGSIIATYILRQITQNSPGTSTLYTPEEVVISDNKNYVISTPPVTYSISAKADKGAAQNASIDISLLEKVSGNRVHIASYYVESVSVNDVPGVSDTKSGTEPSKSIAGISNGTYAMEVIVSLGGSGIGGASAQIDADAELKAVGLVEYQEIGIDGFNFINSATDYIHNSPDSFVVKKGTKTIEVTSSYVKINGVIQ